MNSARRGLRIAVLGDSSATLYYQDPIERLAVAGASAWPELLPTAIGRPDVSVTNLAGVGQQLREGLGSRYAVLDAVRPDVVVISHGGREGVLALPRLLAWLRCYAHNESPYHGRHHLRQRIRRPLWAGLVALVTRHPRLSRALLRPLNVRPVDADTRRFRTDLHDLVAGLVERQARVILIPSFIGHHSFWPLFTDVVATNEATFYEVAAAFGDRVTVLDLQPRVADSDFTGDGAHLTVSGHREVARLVAAHILQAQGAGTSVPMQARADAMAVA